MKVKDLMALLEACPEDTEVCVYSGKETFNKDDEKEYYARVKDLSVKLTQNGGPSFCYEETRIWDNPKDAEGTKRVVLMIDPALTPSCKCGRLPEPDDMFCRRCVHLADK